MAPLKQKPIVVLFVLSVLASFILYHQVLKLLILPTWDEAHNSYYGYLVFRAMRNLDFASLWSTIYNQVFYPPLQSILIGLFSLLAGFSIRNIRLLNLFFLLPSILLTFKLGSLSYKKHGQAVGFLAALLVLTSPMVLLFSTIALKETLGLFFTLFILFLFSKKVKMGKPVRQLAEKDKRIWLDLLIGVTLFLLHLLKYNYGVMVFVVLALEWLITTASRKGFIFQKRFWRQFWASGLALFLPTILGMAWWAFSGPSRFEVIFNYLKNPWQFTLTKTNTLGHLLLVPSSLSSSYILSPVMAPFLLLGFLGGLGYLKNAAVRVHVLLFLLNAVLLTHHFGNQQERFLFISFPSFILVACFGLAMLWQKVQLKKTLVNYPALSGISIAIAIFIGLSLARDLYLLPQLVRQVGAHQMHSPIFNQTYFQDTWFVFDRRKWPKVMIEPQRPSTTDVIDFVLKQTDVSKPIKIVGTFNELSPLLWKLFIQQEKDKLANQNLHPEVKGFVVTLEVEPESPFYTQDYSEFNARQLGQVAKIKQDKNLKVVGKKYFEELKLEVNVFQKN